MESKARSTGENATEAALLLDREGFETVRMRESKAAAAEQAGKGGSKGPPARAGPPARGPAVKGAGKGQKGKAKRSMNTSNKPTHLLCEVVIVTNTKHAMWAKEAFVAQPMFADAQFDGVEVSPEKLEQQVAQFYNHECNSYDVKMRLQNIQARVPGIDAM